MMKDGEFTQVNIRNIHKGKFTPLQEIDYLCRDGINEYTPKFFFGGFQYAEVETDIPFEKENFTAIAVYSDLEETASFSCSHPLINKFFENTRWSLKSNSTDVPTDCPTRERMGWTGDSEVFFNTAAYMADYAAFARKHVRDIFDRRWKNGCLPQIAPWSNEDFVIYGLNGSVGWACAGVYIPLYLYERYGDQRVLEEHYNDILDYADFMIRRAGKWGGFYSTPLHLSRENRKYAVNSGRAYGEWAEPVDVNAFRISDFVCPHPEETTAYIVYMLGHMAEIAAALGKKDDEALYKRYADRARLGYQKLIETKKYSYDTDRQAKLVRPLYMGLLNKEQEEFAKKRLIKALDNYGWRLGTGFLSTPFILYVLADMNIEYAYRLLENEEMPGWLFMPKMGANTIWESWEGTKAQGGVASLDHYSKGAVCEWLFGQMCGINVAGENKFMIAPKPGGSLTYAKAEYQSIYGKVSCGWQKTEKGYTYAVTIPSNCTAEILLPDGRKKTVGAGEYTF